MRGYFDTRTSVAEEGPKPKELKVTIMIKMVQIMFLTLGNELVLTQDNPISQWHNIYLILEISRVYLLDIETEQEVVRFPGYCPKIFLREK